MKALNPRVYARDEVDRFYEVCDEMNNLREELVDFSNDVVNEIECLRTELAGCQRKKPKKKGIAMTKMLVICAVTALLAIPAFAYERDDISYDVVSNPTLLEEYLRDVLAEADYWRYTPQSSAPGTPSEGDLYYNDTANALYLYTGSAWSALASGTGTSLDGAYDLGDTITVDGDVLELENGSASNNSLLLLDNNETTNNNDAFQITNAGTGDAISIDGASTGNLIYDEDGNYTVSSTGAVTFKGGSCVTTDFKFDDTYDILWDTSADSLIAQDNAKFVLGTDADWLFSCDDTDGNLEAAAANDQFRLGETTHFDLVIHGQTNTNEVTFDTDDSALLCIFDGFDLRLNDDDRIVFGDSSEFVLEYDENGDDDLVLVAATANDQFCVGDGTTGTDFVCVSSAGTTTTHAVWFDASGNTNEGIWKFGNDDHGMDVEFYGETASQLVTWDHSADTWYFGDDAEGIDVYFNADTTGDYWLWDESDEALEGVGVQIHLDDDSDLQFGTDKDFSVYSDTADTLEFDPATAGNGILLGTAYNDAVDVTWYGDTNGDTVAFDEENCEVLFTDIDLQLDDAAKLIFGTGDDITVYSDTADTLTIDAGAAGDTLELGAAYDDAFDVVWYGDVDGDTVTFTEETCEVIFEDITLTMQDDTTITFGDGDDITVEYDEDGTDTLLITGNTFVSGTFGSSLVTEVVAGTADTLTAAQSGSVLIYTQTGGACTVTLPEATAAEVGVYYWIVDANATGAVDLKIDPEGAGTINGAAAGNYVENQTDADGCAALIVCTAADTWYTIYTPSAWAEE